MPSSVSCDAPMIAKAEGFVRSSRLWSGCLDWKHCFQISVPAMYSLSQINWVHPVDFQSDVTSQNISQRYHSLVQYFCDFLKDHWRATHSSIMDVDVLAKSFIPSKLFVTVLVLLSFLLGAWNPKQSGTKTAKTILSYWIVIDASSTNKPLACFNNLFQVPGDDP